MIKHMKVSKYLCTYLQSKNILNILLIFDPKFFIILNQIEEKKKWEKKKIIWELKIILKI